MLNAPTSAAFSFVVVGPLVQFSVLQHVDKFSFQEERQNNNQKDKMYR